MKNAVSVFLDQSETLCLLRLEGEVDIASAAELKKLLLQALASGNDLHVDVERATELDVTAMQLLWAAERAARGAGTGFTLVGRLPEEILAAASEAGLEKFPGPIDPK